MGSFFIDRLLDDADLMAQVCTAAGWAAPADSSWEVERLPCVLTNMTTEDLARLRLMGTAPERSLIVKVVRSPRHSPLWEAIPSQFHEQVLDNLSWRAEPALYACRLRDLLPEGLGMPTVYAITNLGDERIALWMEDVRERPEPWTRADYHLVARALGRMAGRFQAPHVPEDLPIGPRDLRGYFFNRVGQGALPLVRDDASWSHPLVAASVDDRLRGDLEELVRLGPSFLDALDALPRTLSHGDACPQNMLRPDDGSAEVVAIDWTFAGITAVGTDAGQLLAGRCESGELEASALPQLYDDILASFTAGLDDEDAGIDHNVARFGATAALVIRSAFTALPLDELPAGDHPALRQRFARRAGYARFLVDLGLGLSVPA